MGQVQHYLGGALAAGYIPVAVGVPDLGHGGVVLAVEPLQVLLRLLLIELELNGDIAHFGHQWNAVSPYPRGTGHREGVSSELLRGVAVLLQAPR